MTKGFIMTNDQSHSAMRARGGGGEGPPTGGWWTGSTLNPSGLKVTPHSTNCDTVRLAIRLRSRRISCSFGLSRLAEKAGSYPDCPARYEKSHLTHMSRAACHAGRVLIRLPPRALATMQASSDLRHNDCFRQRVYSHVSRVPASFARCSNDSHAVLAHVRKRHRRSEILAASVGHVASASS
jgi:hypothetical protein